MTDSKPLPEICCYCGQSIRPMMYLTAKENEELLQLAIKDWRAWAKRVLEINEPRIQEAREKLHWAIESSESNSDRRPKF